MDNLKYSDRYDIRTAYVYMQVCVLYYTYIYI